MSNISISDIIKTPEQFNFCLVENGNNCSITYSFSNQLLIRRAIQNGAKQISIIEGDEKHDIVFNKKPGVGEYGLLVFNIESVNVFFHTVFSFDMETPNRIIFDFPSLKSHAGDFSFTFNMVEPEELHYFNNVTIPNSSILQVFSCTEIYLGIVELKKLIETTNNDSAIITVDLMGKQLATLMQQLNIPVVLRLINKYLLTAPLTRGDAKVMFLDSRKYGGAVCKLTIVENIYRRRQLRPADFIKFSEDERKEVEKEGDDRKNKERPPSIYKSFKVVPAATYKP
jgi:hypothetical protein